MPETSRTSSKSEKGRRARPQRLPTWLEKVCDSAKASEPGPAAALSSFSTPHLIRPLAYPSSTTTCRSHSRRVRGVVRPSRGLIGESMQDRASELPRISILRTRVNNGVRAGVVRLGHSMDIGQLPSTLASTPPPRGTGLLLQRHRLEWSG